MLGRRRGFLRSLADGGATICQKRGDEVWWEKVLRASVFEEAARVENVSEAPVLDVGGVADVAWRRWGGDTFVLWVGDLGM